MKLTVRTKYIILAIITTVLAVFLFGLHLGHKKTESVLNAVISTYSNRITTYIITSEQQEACIEQNKQEILSFEAIKHQSEVKRDVLREINIRQAKEITRLKLRIDTLKKELNHNPCPYPCLFPWVFSLP